tara:strand:+ start:1336 stop:2136 length:801 start_codon:yes stop_codon:yes gene_type:complete
MTVALTYALPMYRAKNIGWLALESLCRQENVDFEWELIIIEEALQSMGESRVHEYKDRLEQVGCVRLEYVRLPEWIPLSQKWINIARLADSEGFLLAGCDDYAPPNRLSETKAMFDAGAEWTHVPVGLFYNIANDNFGVFDYSLANHVCGLDKAGLTEIVKSALPTTATRTRSVDGWVYDQIVSYLGRPPHTHMNMSEDWKRGVFTDGLNNICKTRRDLYGAEIEPPFRRLKPNEPQSLKEVIPVDVTQSLRRVRRSALVRKEFIK